MTTRTKDEVVRELVQWHFQVEPDIQQIFRIVAENENAPDEPIKLLEVTAATIATGSVEPFAFGPSESRPFSTVIAEITPEELERIQRNEIRLPNGWSLANAERLKRPGSI